MNAPALSTPIRAVTLVAAMSFLADCSSGQVPAGYAVVCTETSRNAAYIPGTPGLFLVPLAGGPVTRITGLPPELSTDGLGAYRQGAYCVSIRATDGAVLVTNTSNAGSPSAGNIYLFVLHLNGAAVVPAMTQQILLGTASNAGFALHAQLPDGRIAIGAAQNFGALASGPMAGRLIAIVDPSAAQPTITVLPNPTGTVIGPVGGAALDPTGQFFYWVQSTGLWGQNPGSDAHVFRYEFATGQNCTMAVLIGESAFGLRCDDDGTIYVGTTNTVGVTHSIFTIRPNGCSPAAVSSVTSTLPLLASGMDLDRASGRFVVACCGDQPWVPNGFRGPHLDSLVLVDRVSGLARAIAKPPAGGWGTMSALGVAVNNAIESYGTASASATQQNHYWFENFPNPGGQPVLGNAGFSLTMTSAPNAPAAPGPLLSMLLLSFGRGSTNVLGMEILVSLPVLASALPAPVPYLLPIPNAPALRGVVLDAQSLHFEQNGGFASSAGLEFTLL